MNLRQVASLTVARLGLPVPMAKLVTIQAIARGLSADDTATEFAEALAEWLATRSLESECLEAICPLIIAPAKMETIDLVRRAVCRPSVASDEMFSLVTGAPILVASWTGCHSGPAIPFGKQAEEEAKLREGTFIPPLFVHRLEHLESMFHLPLMRQWAFEFWVLTERYCGSGDEYLEYFRSGRDGAGPAVAHRSHLARSSFLRTLACAVEHWGLPLATALEISQIALPADPIFLRVPPQNAPRWASRVQRRAVSEIEDCSTFAKALIETLELELDCRLMHCSFAVLDEARRHVEFEVFAIGNASDDLDATRVHHFYRQLLGQVTPTRDNFRAFVSPDCGCEGTEALGFVPLLLPLIGPIFGYLQSDLIRRVPYMPVSSTGLPNLELVPSKEGAVLRSDGREVGSWGWWRWNWNPTHPRHLPSPTACYTSLTKEAAQQLVENYGGAMLQIWQIRTWTRDTDFGEWTKKVSVGRH